MRPFELQDVLMDRIRVAMENQEEIHLLDTHMGLLVPAVEVDEDPDRFIALPQWTSIQGFALMEGFTAGLHNPLMRHRLHSILKGGKGVFRLFKDALKERPDVERLWLRYKDREMRRHIWRWYNEYREFWGLARLGEKREERDLSPVMSDFSLSPLDAPDLAWVMDRESAAFLEAWDDADLGAWLHRAHGSLTLGVVAADKLEGLVARTPDGENAGFVVWTRDRTPGGEGILVILRLWVEADWRGLGLGRLMLRETGTYRARVGASHTLVPWCGSHPWIHRLFQSEGYNPFGASFMASAPGVLSL